MTQHKRIFVIGNPGTGKVLFAKTLAEKLGWEFVNTDLELEFRVGRTITDIVGQEGIQPHLECESEILKSQLNKENVVVNTDATIVLSDTIMQQLSSELVVYLQVSIPVQVERTVRNPNQLLPVSNMSDFFHQLHERDHLYEKMATVTINTDDGNLDEHVNIVVKQFTKYGDANKLTLNKQDLIVFHKTLHTPIDLTEQQARCLKLLAQGMSSKEIAKEMHISFRTVEGLIAKLIEVLGCSSSKELISLYHDKP